MRHILIIVGVAAVGLFLATAHAHDAGKRHNAQHALLEEMREALDFDPFDLVSRSAGPIQRRSQPVAQEPAATLQDGGEELPVSSKVLSSHIAHRPVYRPSRRSAYRPSRRGPF